MYRTSDRNVLSRLANRHGFRHSSIRNVRRWQLSANSDRSLNIKFRQYDLFTLISKYFFFSLQLAQATMNGCSNYTSRPLIDVFPLPTVGNTHAGAKFECGSTFDHAGDHPKPETTQRRPELDRKATTNILWIFLIFSHGQRPTLMTDFSTRPRADPCRTSKRGPTLTKI